MLDIFFEFVFEAVGDDNVAALGELCEVVFDLEAIEVAAVGEGWFVDNNLYAFAAEILNDVPIFLGIVNNPWPNLIAVSFLLSIRFNNTLISNFVISLTMLILSLKK